MNQLVHVPSKIAVLEKEKLELRMLHWKIVWGLMVNQAKFYILLYVIYPDHFLQGYSNIYFRVCNKGLFK